jgi:hypothetical protein
MGEILTAIVVTAAASLLERLAMHLFRTLWGTLRPAAARAVT